MNDNLLGLVQTILSRMGSDEVNSIEDTVESLQVATIVRDVYFDIIYRANLPEHFSLITLDASGTDTKPVLMTVPSTVREVMWVKYNKATDDDPEIQMQDIEYLDIKDFLNMMYRLDTSESEVDSFTQTIGTDVFTILYKNNVHPQYYTTFDDYNILFDSFNLEVDDTLQKSKTLCGAKLEIPFTMEDDFTPDLDDPQFNLLLNEALSVAYLELKQQQHPKAEQSARRAWVNVQKNKSAVKGLSDLDKLPNFGRR